MNSKGLIMPPDFDNPSKYLEGGSRTKVTNKIAEVTKDIDGITDGVVVRNLLVWMHTNTERLHDSRDSRKFKRTAEEILESGERTGCCDSSTLFTALARSKNIPTMQVITLRKKGGENGTDGHYYTSCFLKDTSGKGQWVLIDSDREVDDPREVRLQKMNLDNRNIDTDYYAFAYTKDYGEIEYKGVQIDSIQTMNEVQRMAYEDCDEQDFSLGKDNNIER